MHLFGSLSLLVILAITTIALLSFNHINVSFMGKQKGAKDKRVLLLAKSLSVHQRGFPVVIC